MTAAKQKDWTWFCAGAAEMQVRALRDVAQGEHLCVAYVNLTEDRRTRQRQLLEGKQFLCACQRCSQPLPKSNDRFLEVRTIPFAMPLSLSNCEISIVLLT